MVPPPETEAQLALSSKQRLERLLGKFQGIADFFGDAAGAVEKSSAIEAVAKSLPWIVGAIGESAKEALPPVKFAVSLIQKLLQENDPKVLGLLVCTLAYQGAVEEAIARVGTPERAKQVTGRLKDEILALEADDEVDFGKFSFATALGHPFVKRSDVFFRHYLAGTGYSEDQQRLIVSMVHRRFPSLLKAILSHRDTKEKFDPFARLLLLGTDEELAYDAVLTHVEYQRWQFEEERIFGNEPFALKHVYIDTECGVLTWGEIQEGAKRTNSGPDRFDPFDEKHGGRHDLMKTVTDLMKRKDFHEAIVVQGVAGSGKSSFTLKLCSVLAKEGLYPIRIRLRDLPLDRHVSLAIPIAMFPKDLEYPESAKWENLANPFEDGILKTSVPYGEASIRPHVLILDGWDEISLSAQEGYKQRVSKMLDEVKNEYFKRGGPPVRVILTGRPSAEVGETNFLTPRTPVLTVRPIKPADLREFVHNTRMALKGEPCGHPESDTHARWSIPPDEELEAVFGKYQADFAVQREKADAAGASRREGTGPLAVLGLPLLAYLAIRLIAQWQGDRVALISDTTTLYRHLADLTCVKRGQPVESAVELDGDHPTGYRLRRHLHKIAAAMTAYGEESIGHDELALRLDLEDLDDTTQRLTKESPLSTLMIAFFFKGGHKALGCEFLHKSFREYFFAEGLVEDLKEFAKEHPGIPRPAINYWQDYDSGDPQYAFSRLLSEILSPQWLSPEVVVHLERLLAWDIGRASDEEILPDDSPNRCECPPASVDRWEQIRDRLADLWRWWGDGVPMRPQTKRERGTRQIVMEPPYADELVKLDLPRDWSSTQRKPEPARTTTMDAHLGDGLFRIAAVVHYQLALRQGWLHRTTREGNRLTPKELWDGVVGPSPAGWREGVTNSGMELYQAKIRGDAGQRWAFFAPAGFDGQYFENFVARINASGWRPGGIFPHGVNMNGIYLSGARIGYSGGMGTNYRPTSWVHSNLAASTGLQGYFWRNDFREVLAERANFMLAMLGETIFLEADLSRAELGYSYFLNADFTNSNIESAAIHDAYVMGACFTGSKAEGLNADGQNWDDVIDPPSQFRSKQFKRAR